MTSPDGRGPLVPRLLVNTTLPAVQHLAGVSPGETRRLAFPATSMVVLFLGVNVAAALLARMSSAFATLWALGAFTAGLAYLAGDRCPRRLTQVVAYIAGAELLWRGTHASVFWEYGKYSVILLLGVGVFRFGLANGGDRRALLFAAALIPSLGALPEFDRQSIAFNLSGPVSLAVCTFALSAVQIERGALARLCLAALGPTTGLGALALAGMAAAREVGFVPGSKVTAAGIGPNQVSSALGLGSFLAFCLVFLAPRRGPARYVFAVLSCWLAAQSVLSLSRGGFWTAVGASLVLCFYVLRSPRTRGAAILIVGAMVLVAQFKVLPALDDYTRGTVTRRFTDRGLTGRDQIMRADLILFRENPLFGVGPGQSYGGHALTFRPSSAHTEYTRLLAEHGAFGVLAVLMLLAMVWTRWRRAEPLFAKGLSLAFTAWTFLYMFHAAMRLVAPGLMFGLGAARLIVEEPDEERDGRRMVRTRAAWRA